MAGRRAAVAFSVATVDERSARWLAPACELPDGFPPTTPEVLDLLVLPDDDRDGVLARRLAEVASTVAYIALSYAGEVIGTLHAVRAAVLPFNVRERCLARAIADQAVVALTAVKLL